MAITPLDPPRVGHPLDPLTADEISRVASILRAQPGLSQRIRLNTIALREPTRDELAGYTAGQPIQREAFGIVLDNATGTTYEAIVSLESGAVTSWEAIPGVQPAI